MSRRQHRYEPDSFKRFGLSSRKPTLPMIIILILILLQFGGEKFIGPVGDSHIAGFNGVDNGILFIIALFYLSCGNIGKSGC